MPLIDTHAHLSYEPLQTDWQGVLARADAAGITRIVAVATDLLSTRACVALAQQYPQLYATAGIHPNHLLEIQPDDWATISELANDPRVVAWGETGLDRYWKDVPFELQVEWFHRHVKAARDTRKPIIIHTRECDEDIVRELKVAAADGPVAGVMHSFTGTWDTAEYCLELGLYISFAGMVTFKKSRDLLEIAARVPRERILVETDSPYLSPEPLRGKFPNEPARVVHTARVIAHARNQTFDEFSQQTTENAERLFGWKANR